MITRLLIVVVVLIVLALGGLWVLGRGWLVSPMGAGTPTATPSPEAVVAARTEATRSASEAIGAPEPKQILFGDLHVHTTYSFDAFTMSLPLAGGDGAHPVADACDFARYCSGLDFWSINDHGLALTPQRWRETVDAIRQCNAIGGDPSQPDVVSFLGWEWTQVGTRPENHYGHKNVILRDLEDGRIPTRPVAAVPPGPVGPLAPSTLRLGLFALFRPTSGGIEFARYAQDLAATPICPTDVPVRELSDDCREQAATPQELFAKLDDWGHEALVIPHGTTWGYYTPGGSSWDKQLTEAQHDAGRQRLVEVFSGHGNSEEYRRWREVVLNADGTRSCPEPSPGYLPSCWRAGELIRARCVEAGEPEDVCRTRAARARQNYVDADRNGGAWTVPGATGNDWLDSGQCTDCFQPAFNYRPRSSVQYMMALSQPRGSSAPLRFRFGFIASSDNHSARPGTGYKEFARSELTEARFGNFLKTPLGMRPARDPAPVSEPYDIERSPPIFGVFETERQASYFLNGGLVAVHANGRDRNAIFESLARKEVYGTSGPRILLWFDLVNAPAGRDRVPMGGSARLSEAPTFEVRAVGSFEPQPGCPDYSASSLEPARLARLCQGECYHPSDRRRTVTRIEVVRIRPQRTPGEDVRRLIEDPWRVLPCEPDPAGCRVRFSDEEFAAAGRDALYYVRAIEEPSLAVDADPLRCEYDGEGRCVRVRPCFSAPREDDCLTETEERAWSSPIFVDFEPPQP
jgi:hypothetical protein